MKLQKPELIKSSLVIASVFLAGHELLKNSIIQKLKGFICFDSKLTKDGSLSFVETEEYKRLKNKRHPELENQKNEYYSCCLWYLEEGIISSDDLVHCQDIIKQRNKVAHELPEIIIDDNVNINVDLFFKMRSVLRKIEKHWASIHFDTHGIEISNESEIQRPVVSLMDYIIEIADSDLKKVSQDKST